jgi:FkbM family methyltransferase
MKNFFYTIFNIARSYRLVDAVRLLLSYIRIIIRNRISSLDHNKEKFLNYTIEFPFRPAFFGLLTEIFFRPLVIEKRNCNRITIIDCGANIGIRMLYYKWLYPNAKIICFEPNPINLKYLNKNISINRLEGVVVYPFALGINSGKKLLYYDNEIRGLGSGNLFKPVCKDRDGCVVEVDVVKLSHYIDGKVYLVKLDIEGSEGEVIDDLEENNKFKCVDRMLIEYHYDGVSMVYPLSKMLIILKNNNYNVQQTQLTPQDFIVGQGSQTCMVLCSK